MEEPLAQVSSGSSQQYSADMDHKVSRTSCTSVVENEAWCIMGLTLMIYIIFCDSTHTVAMQHLDFPL